MKRHTTALACLATALSCWLSAPALHAQPVLPATIKLVVGYPPGGSTDTLARLLGQGLQEQLKVPVIVDNRPGAGGRIAAAQLKKAPADGSEVMVAPNALTTVQSLVYADKLPYSVVDDFVPVAKLASYPFTLSVPTTSPIKSVTDLVAWVRSNPQQASFGSSGAGGMAHFSGLMVAKEAGFEWVHVAYKGGAPLVTELIGGHIPAGVDTVIDHIEHHRAGTSRILGVTGAKRYPLTPDLPTLAEQGVKGLGIEGWFGAFVPAGTPAATVARLEDGVRRVLSDPAFKAKVNKLAIEVDFKTSAELRATQVAELQTWAPVVKASGFKPE